jgi:hypothetical protein
MGLLDRVIDFTSANSAVYVQVTGRRLFILNAIYPLSLLLGIISIDGNLAVQVGVPRVIYLARTACLSGATTSDGPSRLPAARLRATLSSSKGEGPAPI